MNHVVVTLLDPDDASFGDDVLRCDPARVSFRRSFGQARPAPDHVHVRHGRRIRSAVPTRCSVAAAAGLAPDAQRRGDPLARPGPSSTGRPTNDQRGTTYVSPV